MKRRGYQRPAEGYVPIHMPRNTGAGFVLAALAGLCGFALIWHMWLIAAAVFVVLIVAAIVHTFNYQRDNHIAPDDVARSELARTQALAAHG
jgi:cytochrome o ubiquinol oxidase subunit 1